MITNAVIGLVMTLTCGLMLRVVNPTLLTNNTLTIEPVIIEKGVDRVSKGLPIGSLCNESRNSLCSSDLKCASISACKMDTVEGDGVCIYPNSKLVCLKGSCKTDETVTYCAPQVMNYNVTQKTFCIDGVCEYNNPNKPATNSSAPLVGGGELCSVSSDAQNSCVAGYKCLSCISTNSANGIECKKDGKGNDGESRCYPETCKKIIPVAPSSPENTYCSSSNCCMYPFVCGKDNVCENK
ncbi:MAG: hypothetical protein QMB51_03040 [Patescibacteria group bacterium]